jgi:signal peptidase I
METIHREAFLTSIKETGTCRVQVGGGSMRPCINDGETVIVQKAILPLKPGMIAAFFCSDQFIVHRITSCIVDKKRIRPDKKEPYLYRYKYKVAGDTFGDAIIIEESEIVGVVIGIEKNGTCRRFGFTPVSGMLVMYWAKVLRLLRVGVMIFRKLGARTD